MSLRWGTINVHLVEGNLTILKVPCTSYKFTPRSCYLIILFSLDNIHSKKLVLLIASEGKKWGFHYLYDHKWW